MAFTKDTFSAVGSVTTEAATVYSYRTLDDEFAIKSVGYFSSIQNELEVGDVILADTDSGFLAFKVSSDKSTVIDGLGRNDYVLSGYGGILSQGSQPLSAITATWQTLNVFTGQIISTPRSVTQDFANHGLRLQKPGVWSISIQVSLLFINDPNDRDIKLRVYNDTQGFAYPNIITFGTGRDQSQLNLAVNVLVDFPTSDINDLLILQIQTTTGINYLGASTENVFFQANYVSEQQVT